MSEVEDDSCPHEDLQWELVDPLALLVEMPGTIDMGTGVSGDLHVVIYGQHYIEWIELIADGKAYRQFLEPGQEPEAMFAVEADSVTAREYCNLHGLWKA